MKLISLDEAKKIELDILIAFADFCDKTGLTYFLAYGSLIGAIRHKGFIPWDDDIDLNMKRADYDKLRATFNDAMKDTPYKLIDIYDKESNYSYVKIVDTRTVKYEYRFNNLNDSLGIDLDIFPLSGCPTDLEEYRKWYKKLRRLYRRHFYKKMALSKMFDFKLKSFYHLFNMIRLGCLGSDVTKILKKAEKMHSDYLYEDCELVGSFESYFGTKEGCRWKKEWFEDTVLVDFEGYKFKAPKNYHEVLTTYFGDYMTPPPKEQQVTHHKNNMFWK